MTVGPPEGESPSSNSGESTRDKDTVRRFVLRITQPFEMKTKQLGTVVARSMTVGASATFLKRMKSFDGVSDSDLVRAYMGSVSGIPVEDAESLPPSLTLDQVSLLDADDIEEFSRLYLEKIVKRPVQNSCISEMAGFIRKERQEHIESARKTAETMRSALNVGATAEIMKNWGELTKNIAGPVENLRDEMDRVLGPLGSMRSTIGDTLRDLRLGGAVEEARKAADALNSLGLARSSVGDLLGRPSFGTAEEVRRAIEGLGQESHPALQSPDHLFESSMRFPLPPPVNETPVGRTAIAVEHLHVIGQRMEGAMTIVVQQAGNVSEQMGQVLKKIENEAEKGQKATRWALVIAVGSLLLSAAGFVASAYFSQLGYDADRRDASAGDKIGADIVKGLEAQNSLLREILRQKELGAKATISAAGVGDLTAPKNLPVSGRKVEQSKR